MTMENSAINQGEERFIQYAMERMSKINQQKSLNTRMVNKFPSKKVVLLKAINILDEYFCQSFIQRNLVKTSLSIEKLAVNDVYKEYLNACIEGKRENALPLKLFHKILDEQNIKLFLYSSKLYIVGYHLNVVKKVSLNNQPDPFKEYTVEEVIQAGWFSENNEQGIYYRRIKFGSLKAKRVSSKRVVILGSSIIEALTKSDDNLSI